MRMVVCRVPAIDHKSATPRARHENKGTTNVQPVHPDGRQILDMQRDERPSESIAHVLHLGHTQPMLEFTCEPVCFPLKATRDEIERDADDSFHRRQDHLAPHFFEHIYEGPRPKHLPGTSKTPPSSADGPRPPLRNQTRE